MRWKEALTDSFPRDSCKAPNSTFVSSGAEPVYVSKALQKAKIEVNEDGTKASAVTSEYSYIDAFF